MRKQGRVVGNTITVVSIDPLKFTNFNDAIKFVKTDSEKTHK